MNTSDRSTRDELADPVSLGRDLREFQVRLSRRLLVWSLPSAAVGLLLAFLGTEFWRGFGVQAAAWGAIDALIAWLGLASARRRERRGDRLAGRTPAAEGRRLRRILQVNGALDVLYVAGGLVVALTLGRRSATALGHGLGVIVQGSFLLFFDWMHAWVVPQLGNPGQRDRLSRRTDTLELSQGIEAPAEPGGPSLWFVFQEDRLLVRDHGESVLVPEALCLEELGIAQPRSQFVGTLTGRSCYAAEVDAGAAAPAGMSFRNLRSLWGSVSEELFWTAGTAFQVMDWDRTHQFCGRCGTPTAVKPGERARICSHCSLTFYPRISPAVIVAVVKGDRILLARAPRFPVEMYSVIAGFVNPGESLEECVHREVAEETGLRVKNLRYFGSQPWPFPNSLMVGFTAEYAGGDLVADPGELAEADWFSASAMPRIPEPPSIARRLIDWFLEGCRS